MKIVLTGAGGGHFYPLIAVVERMRKEVFIQKIVQPEVYFFSDAPYDEKALFNAQIKFIKIPAGKLHVYPSLETVGNIFKTGLGCIAAFFKLYALYPDAVFAKGGYASFPTLLAARLLSIPVIIHESDTVPGRTTTWAGKFASRVAISYPEAGPFFPKDTTALTGLPIREGLLPPEGWKRESAPKDRPTILVIGGSQGSQRINETILSVLPELLNSYDIVHQVGVQNLEEMKKLTSSLLRDHEYKDHYFIDGFIDVGLFYPKVDMAICRAGSQMFELVEWQLPMIVIPIPETISRDQRSNAHAMAGRGVATVIEENNLGNSVVLAEIKRILDDPATYMKMSENCIKAGKSRQAATTIARELVRIGLSHV